MARMKKATVKKAAPKKRVKRPAQKEELAPVPTQQNPQPPMGTPPMGANGPMMRKGGKIKKMQGGGPAKDKYKNLGGEIGNPPFDKNSPVLPLPGRPAQNMPKVKAKVKVVKKAQGGTSFAKLAPPYDKATYADKIAGAKKNAGTAKSGTKIKKAMMGKTMMKSGGKMKTCKGGC